ncbi:MAG: cbb3-type cytochrome c oxidase subunit 3 [Gemmatimonadetes bacterium]|nr:cbb3-type cytochrome c oxidase subunit 3 [Gemmatimonadota bacterium]
MRSLADVVGASGLSGYAIVALILFFLAFVAVAINLLLPSRSALYERAGRMPLDDLNPQTPREP